MVYKEIHTILQSIAQEHKNENVSRFFKTAAGSYAEHDTFIGVKVPVIRSIAKQYKNISFEDIAILLRSSFNEERLLALIILTMQYKKANDSEKESLYQFYMDHLSCVNNWNLVDTSAPLIVGAYLHQKEKNILVKLALSPNIWERRIAIVSTLYFIRHNDLEWTFTLAEKLLNDTHDLIHKAVGWMLKEAGAKNQSALTMFLDQYAIHMPRTMLRYAIEKLPKDKRLYYLHKKSSD